MGGGRAEKHVTPAAYREKGVGVEVGWQAGGRGWTRLAMWVRVGSPGCVCVRARGGGGGGREFEASLLKAAPAACTHHRHSGLCQGGAELFAGVTQPVTAASPPALQAMDHSLWSNAGLLPPGSFSCLAAPGGHEPRTACRLAARWPRHPTVGDPPRDRQGEGGGEGCRERRDSGAAPR